MERWHTLASRLVFQRGRVRVNEDTVQLASGEQTTYLVVQGGPGVAVLAVDNEGRVVLTRQYRHPVGKVLFELPGGGTRRGETLEAAALRELREEVGLTADKLVALGSFFPSPARANIEVFVFLATDVSQSERDLDPGEDIEIHHVPLTELRAMCSRNEVQDATLIFGLAMAERKGLLD